MGGYLIFCRLVSWEDIWIFKFWIGIFGNRYFLNRIDRGFFSFANYSIIFKLAEILDSSSKNLHFMVLKES